MTNNSAKITTQINTALAWCLAWGNEREPQFNLDILNEMRDAVLKNKPVPSETQEIVQQVQDLQNLTFPDSLKELTDNHPDLCKQETRIGLVYGGATKIKQYVFEAAKLPDIRGASALLDQINLIDLPAFFGKEKSPRVTKWLDENFPNLRQALISELIIYSTGGNILAFCPSAFVHDLANAIEKRYTEETLTANSCAVGDTFKLLEIRFGLLKDPIENTLWLDWYQKNYQDPLVEAYFGKFDSQLELKETFQNRKSFNELAGKLASLFQMRRNGNTLPEIERPTRRFPPMFETHPHIVRDDNQHRSAIAKVNLPNSPWFSDALARKRISGQKAKREGSRGQNWYKDDAFYWQFGEIHRKWNPGIQKSWVLKFQDFLKEHSALSNYYYKNNDSKHIKEAIRTEEIGNQSDDFIAFIYADGNNMGGYIQKIQTPQDYAKFSQDVSKATEQSVYYALAEHLHPHQLKDLTNPESQHRNNLWVHPFEIITIGGDDVMLIVPADKALQIAKTIGEKFEEILLQKNDKYRLYLEPEEAKKSINCHRYLSSEVKLSQCKLSMSTGILITAYNTPIYYAENLTNQLLKSAKKKAKELKKSHDYFGGTIDFLALKSVTMISSNIGEFREQGLTKQQKNHTLKLYAAPYTLHEIGGLVDTIKAFKTSEFPRSQLYQIRSLIELGKQTAILNYRYFRVRLTEKNSNLIQDDFEKPWCSAKTNCGNIAPWMYEIESHTYETIWREIVDLYPFINGDEDSNTAPQPTNQEEAQV
jgi:CRISPR-associated protein Cmr2